MTERVHVSGNHGQIAKLTAPGTGRGKDGDIETGSFWGKAITIKGKDQEGKIQEIQVNEGSLIEYLNARLPKEQQLNKGYIFGLVGRDPSDKVLATFYREFPVTETLPLYSFNNKNNVKIDLFAVNKELNFEEDKKVFIKAYPGFDKKHLGFFENGLEWLNYFFNESVSENIQKQTGIYTRAYVGDKLAGGVYCKMNWEKNNPAFEKSIYVDQIFIDPEFQNGGIGKELLFSVFKKEGIESHYDSIVVLVEYTAQKGTKMFYERLGFQPVDYKLVPFNVRGGQLYKWTKALL